MIDNVSSEKELNNFKLIELLKTFSPLEIKRFSRFLRSPYFNNNQNLIRLFEHLRSFHSSYIHAKFERIKIWKKVFKNDTFNPTKFKKIFFELNALAEEFLVMEVVRTNKRTYSKLFIQAVKYRRFEHFEKESLHLISTIEAKGTSRSPTDFLDLHLLYRDLWSHLEKNKHKTNHQELVANYEYLYIYKEIEKMKTDAEYETRRKFLNIPDISLPYDLKVPTDIDCLPNNDTITLLKKFQQLKKMDHVDFYYDLKSQLLTLKDSLDQSLIRDGITHLNNFSIRAEMNGIPGLTQEVLEILKWAAENDIFVFGGRIYEVAFVNTIITALKEKEIAWAKKYFERNKKYLKSPHKVLYLKYLESAIGFTEKDFEAVIVHLSTLQPSHTFQFYFLIKSLLTRSFFELILMGKINYHDALLYQLASFKNGLLRNRKFSQNKIKSYLNFVKIFQKLAVKKVFLKKDKLALSEVKSLILQTKPLISPDWFIEKIDFLDRSGL